MPDRKQGYVKRHRGILATDTAMAAKYRSAMKETIAEFDGAVQLSVIDAVLDSRSKQGFQTYYVATDATHVHVLVSWRDEREWLHLRSIIKSSLSRRLNQDCGKRTWFSGGGSRKRVKDRAHFDHLTTRYLLKHAGWKWSPETGTFR